MFRAMAQGRAVVASAAVAAAAATSTASSPAQAEALHVHSPPLMGPLTGGTVKLQAARGIFGPPSRSFSQFTSLDNDWDMVDDDEEEGSRRGTEARYSQLFEKVPGQEEVEEATRELCETLRSGTILGSNGLFAGPFAEEVQVSERADWNEASLPSGSSSSGSEYEVTTNSAGNIELQALRGAEKEQDETGDAKERMDSAPSGATEAQAAQENPQVNVLESRRGLATLSARWTGGAPQWPVPQFGGARAVVQAFELFRSDPEVQDTVVSLARDPAVWDAFRNNRQMQELLRRRVSNRIAASDRPVVEERGEPRAPSSAPQNDNPFVVAYDHVKNMLSHLMGSFVDALGSIVTRMERVMFGENDNTESGRNSVLETTMRSCVVVTIVVLAVVVLRRPVIG
ncbi:hypothetical protein CBR_g45942 [Chara braunii]|uniref:Uncharacterized protein n=1 Tax=Chara braunii TaxID=69332 RepID=A0A388LZQ4_CHABU|nr:hypothetical protein CBR_g45942 [Chara braunii]|eukprot:GBG87786.1 hypothetical protein CBR_g45942 [Chara braunii]